MRVLFVEPPKDPWFVMGEYISPPFGILSLASFLKERVRNIDVDVVDCQAEELDWDSLCKWIESFRPDIVAPSSLSTCNAYNVLRTVEEAKKVDPSITTLVGGQHFTALAQESLQAYKDVDIIVRGEGEETLAELVKRLQEKKSISSVKGISFKHAGKVVHNGDRSLIDDLDHLPFPGYNFVKEHMKTYYFTLMTGKDVPFAIIEGSRGCNYNCTYCTQWRFWKQRHRSKSPQRIANEFEWLNREYGSKFIWLTDDNYGIGSRMEILCDDLIKKGLGDDVNWFIQARCDEIVENKRLLPKMRRAGNIWMLVGFDSPSKETLKTFRRRGINETKAKEAVDLLKKNEILCQGTFILGEREDSHESIRALRDYADWLDPDVATFMTLTPFPGTELYEIGKQKGWIEDENWSHYDMIHAIMPTKHLTREEVQKELYKCYRSYYGSWNRRYKGMFSKNPIIKRTYLYLAKKAIVEGLRSLI